MSSLRPAPALELADVIRRHGSRLTGLTCDERRILNDLAACRTAALGGHVEVCDHCQHRRIAYNSCRNRHCPRCQASACARWMNARAAELLPVEYFHVVFTLPNSFNALALSNKRVVYDLLFEAVAQTLLEVAANPRRLGAKIGFIAILHTWGQNLCVHPHVHCVVPGGGLSPDGSRWTSCRAGFFLPVRVLSRVFRGKFIAFLRKAWSEGKLRALDGGAAFERMIESAVHSDWVVYAKPPFGGPAQVLKYLSRYTHRIAISNRRLVRMDDRSVTFRWKDYAEGGQARTMTLDATEFLRRFLLHAVPRGFMRIRHFGLLANRFRSEHLSRCRTLVGNGASSVDHPVEEPQRIQVRDCHGTHDIKSCPVCNDGRMVSVGRLRPDRSLRPFEAWCDSS